MQFNIFLLFAAIFAMFASAMAMLPSDLNKPEFQKVKVRYSHFIHILTFENEIEVYKNILISFFFSPNLGNARKELARQDCPRTKKPIDIPWMRIEHPV